MLRLSTKCWNSAFNAQGSRVIIVVVRVGAVKIYVTPVEALRKNERQDETQFTNQIDGFLSFTSPLNANVLFCWFSFNLTLCMTKLRVLVLCLYYSTDNSIVWIILIRSWVPSHLLLLFCGRGHIDKTNLNLSLLQFH